MTNYIKPVLKTALALPIIAILVFGSSFANASTATTGSIDLSDDQIQWACKYIPCKPEPFPRPRPGPGPKPQPWPPVTW